MKLFAATVALMASAAMVQLAAQAPAKTDGPKPQGKAWTHPRTPWGDPDIQGLWPSTNVAGAPFERPEQFAGRAVLTDEEFSARSKEFAADAERVKQGTEAGAKIAPPPDGDSGGGPALGRAVGAQADQARVSGRRAGRRKDSADDT
jgi:hypothetical protein